MPGVSMVTLNDLRKENAAKAFDHILQVPTVLDN